MYLLDTVVLSEIRKRRANPGVIEWLRSVSEADLYISTISVSEVERGIERVRAHDPAFAVELARWLDATIRAYSDRILPLDVRAARRWGRLAGRLGHNALDLAIAAIALEHGLTVVTRNASDFLPTGVSTVNPFIQCL